MSTNNASAEADAIADEFGFFDDWEDRYQMLIDQAVSYTHLTLPTKA